MQLFINSKIENKADKEITITLYSDHEDTITNETLQFVDSIVKRIVTTAASESVAYSNNNGNDTITIIINPPDDGLLAFNYITRLKEVFFRLGINVDGEEEEEY